MRVFVDLETRSDVDLRNTTPYRYVESLDFRILLAGWSIDGGPVEIDFSHEDAVSRFKQLFVAGATFVAHNAQFERVCLSAALGMPVGEYLLPHIFHDTQAIAGELGLPQGLSKLAVALGAEEKDEAGTRLINLFCKPNRKGGWNGPDTHPMEWIDFVAYLEQDVYTLLDVDRLLGGWNTATEREVYLADQAINDTGILIDLELARAAVVVAEDNRMEQEIEISAMTGVGNPGSQQQMMEWCRRVGLDNDDLRRETVAQLLERADLHDDVRRVLELRQELALVASKKFSAALESVSRDGRLRGSFRFFGAHTGRWTGRGVQPQNLPREQLDDEDLTDAAILDLQMGGGADAGTLKALVRAMFVGPFTVVDYAAIEARVVAWLAGEEWALEAFRADRDIYVETAQRASTPSQELTRSQGKVMVLALGYNGAVGSLRAMGADGSDADLERLVAQWRLANKNICRLWGKFNEAFRTGGEVGPYLSVEKDGRDRLVRLPSGRAIAYRDCRFGQRASFADVRGYRVDTYGGRLTENATQAVARDILAEALVRLLAYDYRVVGHIHDEVVVEGQHLEEVRKIMVEPPDWAGGLPIDAEGSCFKRYRKG